MVGWVRARAGSLPRQFALVVAIVVAPVLIALAVAGSLMVVSQHGAALLAAIVAAAGLVAIIAARLVAGGILRDVQAVRDGLVAVGRGQRQVRIETSANDELAELAAAANAMIAQLRAEETARDQSDAARRDLIAAVSHDLRTPITSLRLLADAIGDDIVEDPETRRGYVRRMATHIDALSVLIDDLFELSRLEAGRHQLVDRAGAAARTGQRDSRGDAGAGRGQGGGGRSRRFPSRCARPRPIPRSSSGFSST